MKILNSLNLPNKSKCIFNETGVDSYEKCLDKKHFISYPWQVVYNYNSRGFRDCEWPENITDLKNSIWCLGDSFTVGLGSPLRNTWPYILSEKTNCRTINVSMDGASNNWISRKANHIYNEILPKTIVICWSFLHRREDNVFNKCLDEFIKFFNDIKDPSWTHIHCMSDFNDLPLHIKKEVLLDHCHTTNINVIYDEDFNILNFECLNDEILRLFATPDSAYEDLENFKRCVQSVHQLSNCNIIHSVIPNFSDPEYHNYALNILTEKNCKFIGYFKNLDIARDGIHFDREHSTEMVNRILQFF